MHADGINVFDEADGNHLVLRVPNNLNFKFLPAKDRLFNKDLVDG